MADLVVTADDRIEFTVARLLREVLPVLLKCLELRLGIAVGHARVTTQLLVDLLDALACHAGELELLARVALVLGERDEQVLGRGKRIAHLPGNLDGIVNHLGEARARVADRCRTRDLRSLVQIFGYCHVDGPWVSAHPFYDCGQVALIGIEQRLEQMLRFDRCGLFVGRDGDRVLQRLLGRDRQLVYSHFVFLRYLCIRAVTALGAAPRSFSNFARCARAHQMSESPPLSSLE